MPFSDLNLLEPLLRAVAEEGYTEPTPIQRAAIPHVLAGRDLLGIAQTGTGKTAAFALPILQRVAAAAPPAHVRRAIRVLILTPTRELAAQIGESFGTYGRHVPVRHAVVFGGVGMGPQKRALSDGVDILVATPGRLLDLMGQRCVHFQHLEIFVLDEADRMLDMGFLPAVQRVIAALPKRRQTLFFSATMPDAAQTLADRLLHAPARVEVTPPATTVERIDQRLYYVEKHDKQTLLEHLLDDPKITRALVFTRTKHGANKVVQRLERAGYDADAIHANKSQRQRERALAAFKSGMSRILVATDIAARGIDVDGISHVVNFDLPNLAEAYVHRIGRTARAGADGIALSFCDGSERAYVRVIERETGQRIAVVEDHPFARGGGGGRPHAPHPPAPHPPAAHPPATPAPAGPAFGEGVAADGPPAPGPACAPVAPSRYGRAGRPDARPYREGARPRREVHRNDGRRPSHPSADRRRGTGSTHPTPPRVFGLGGPPRRDDRGPPRPPGGPPQGGPPRGGRGPNRGGQGRGPRRDDRRGGGRPSGPR